MPAKKKDTTTKEPEKIVKAPSPEETDRLHRKKTKDELQQEIDNSISELEQEEQEEALTDGESEEPEETEEEEEVDVTKTATEEAEEEAKPKEDYRKRYEDSSREAFILHNKNKKMTEAIEKASDITEPTEEELKKEYPEWDEMSDFEQKMAKKDMHNSRKLDAIAEVAKDFKDMDAWSKKIDEYLGDVQTITSNPDLDGREDEFKIFASKESRRGVDFETLTSAFLFEIEKNRPAKTKGKMFETGSAGVNEKPKPKSDKITVEDSIRIRQSNYKEYVRLLREGKIDNSAI